MFGEFWDGNAQWFSRDGTDAMFGGLYQWIEYVWSFTVQSDEEGPRAVLSVDVDCDGIGWRLLYREKNPLPWLSENPYDPMFSATGADPMFPAQAVKPWRPWPGRVQPVRAAMYDFRLVVPGGSEQFRISALSVSVSSDARVRHVLGLSVPALGGTRIPPGEDEWRSVQEVRVVPLGVQAARSVVLPDRNRTKGPWLAAFDAAGAAVAQTVDATLRGY